MPGWRIQSETATAPRHAIVARRRGGSTALPDASGQPQVDALAASLLVVAFLAPGLAQLGAVPDRVELAFDLGAAALLAYVALRLFRRRASIAIPALALLYLAMVVLGLVTEAEPAAVVVALRNFCLVPLLAIALALEGIGERGARWIVWTLLALCALEFAVTLVQGTQTTTQESDEIVGTMGAWNGWVVAFVVLMATAVALARYLLAGGPAWPYLVAAGVLPLFTMWAIVKVVVLLLPVAFGATILAYLAMRSDRSWQRAGVSAAVGVAAVAAILVAYQSSGQLGVFTDSDTRQNYLRDAQFYEPPPASGSDQGETPGGGRDRPAQPRAQQPEQTPGRSTQWRDAVSVAAETPLTGAFGHGLGSATYAANLGVEETSDSRRRYAAYNNFGILVIERGFVGLLVVALCAAGLGLTALRRLPGTAAGDWRSAVVLGYPAVVLLTAAGAFYAAPFQESATELTFWLLTAVVLSLAIRQPARTR